MNDMAILKCLIPHPFLFIKFPKFCLFQARYSHQFIKVFHKNPFINGWKS